MRPGDVLACTSAAAHEAGTFVMNHSCGDVDALIGAYRGRLAFLGGLSTQKTLPYGTPDDVRADGRHLLDLGSDGGYVFAPAHAVQRDVPLENMLAFIETAQSQVGIATA
jgi:uroporphyrinogen decarboxylase